MGQTEQTDSASGLSYGIAAYVLWGLMPLYFYTVKVVRPVELLAQRIVWSVVLLALVLTVFRRWDALRATLAVPRTRGLLLASTLLLAVNWFVYIYGVSTERIVQCSLGYFINPLLNVLLGMIFFRERLRPTRWLALLLAAAGVVYLTAALGEVPWIAFTLACSFAVYGLIRKVVPVDPFIGLMVETLFLLAPSVVFLAWWTQQPESVFGRNSVQLDVLLVASGVVTTAPLLCFGAAARRLRLSTLGFIQYLAPSLQFLLAVLLFKEPFRREQQISFGLIWAALVLASVGRERKDVTQTHEASPPVQDV
jgi:chloramphenicol-sensitive protein RarD